MLEIAQKRLGRREFIRVAGMIAGGTLLAACAPAGQQAVPSGKEGDAADIVSSPMPKGIVKIVATSQMPVDTWKGSIERARTMLPDIDLTVTATQIAGIGWSGYADKIITQIAGGEQLDVIMIAVEGLALLAEKNVLTDLNPLIAGDADASAMIKNDIHPTLTGMLTWKGKLMEIPFSWNNMVLYYNTDILKKKNITPKMNMTWDDFLELCQQVAEVKGNADDTYAYSFWGSSFFGMHAWLFTNDTSFLTDDWMDSNLQDPKVAETIQFMADLILKHKVAPNPSGWNEEGQFLAGHLAMRTCGRWCIGGLLKNEFKSYDLVYQPLRSGNVRTVAGTDGWGVSTSTKNQAEAFQVAKFLSGKEASLDMVRLGGNIPALRSVANMPEFREFGPANTGIFYESLDYAKTVPSPPNFNIIEPIMDRMLAPIWNGEKSVEEALQEGHKQLQAEMDKLKK